MHPSEIRFVLLALAIILAIVIFNALVNFFVRLIREARKWVQFVAVCSIIGFLTCMYIAPEETGEALRVLVELFGMILKGIVKALKYLSGDTYAATLAG